MIKDDEFRPIFTSWKIKYYNGYEFKNGFVTMIAYRFDSSKLRPRLRLKLSVKFPEHSKITIEKFKINESISRQQSS